jgi:tetratricopeptide (TPR) repeat protein
VDGDVKAFIGVVTFLIRDIRNQFFVDATPHIDQIDRLHMNTVFLGPRARSIHRGAAIHWDVMASRKASALLDRALLLNPNLASAWFLAGFLRTWNGEPDAAIEHFTRAMRMSPLDPELYRMQAGLAAAHLFAGRFDTASSWAEKAFRELPSFLMVVSVIAASHALAGRSDEAQRAMKHLRELDPTLRVSNLADWIPIRRAEDRATFADGLRKAGLPE